MRSDGKQCKSQLPWHLILILTLYQVNTVMLNIKHENITRSSNFYRRVCRNVIPSKLFRTEGNRDHQQMSHSLRLNGTQSIDLHTLTIVVNAPVESCTSLISVIHVFRSIMVYAMAGSVKVLGKWRPCFLADIRGLVSRSRSAVITSRGPRAFFSAVLNHS